jgi:prepilin-type N-terminal cleavage/methylation domain-containing protein
MTRARADSAFVLSRLRGEKGFGLIELLMAMTMLSIGIFALVAAFNSGTIALRRASQISTAAALVDKQMELYRGLTYAAIALDPTAVNATDSVYRNDTVLGNISNDVTDGTACAGVPLQCKPTQTVVGADRRTYRVDSYVTWSTPQSGRQLKLVTVVARGATSPYKTYAREQSTFDLSTGS